MRIISSFKDYYDCVQRNGVDEDLIYVRKESDTITIDNRLLDRFSKVYNASRTHYVFSAGYVGFAGKVYPYYVIKEDQIDGMFWREYDESKYEDLFGKDKTYKSKFHSLYLQHNSLFTNRDSLKEASKFFSRENPIFHIQLREYNPPLLRYNCRLNELDFVKKVDPYTAYQELRVWLANQAEPRKPIPTLSDEDKASLHGFNKYSFRMDKKNHPKRKSK